MTGFWLEWATVPLNEDKLLWKSDSGSILQSYRRKYRRKWFFESLFLQIYLLRLDLQCSSTFSCLVTVAVNSSINRLRPFLTFSRLFWYLELFRAVARSGRALECLSRELTGSRLRRWAPLIGSSSSCSSLRSNPLYLTLIHLTQPELPHRERIQWTAEPPTDPSGDLNFAPAKNDQSQIQEFRNGTVVSQKAFLLIIRDEQIWRGINTRNNCCWIRWRKRV